MTRLSYAWDFDADGDVDSRAQNPTFTYTERGIFDATLRVSDTRGPVGVGVGADHHRQSGAGGQPDRRVDVAAVRIRQHGHFTVTVTDDQPVDCSRVAWPTSWATTARASADVDRRMLGRHPGAARRRGARRTEHLRRVRGDLHGRPGGEEPQQGTDEVIQRGRNEPHGAPPLGSVRSGPAPATCRRRRLIGGEPVEQLGRVVGDAERRAVLRAQEALGDRVVEERGERGRSSRGR